MPCTLPSLLYLIGIIAGAMTKSCGYRLTCLFGMCICGLGVTLAVFSTNYYAFLVTFGVVKGEFIRVNMVK